MSGVLLVDDAPGLADLIGAVLGSVSVRQALDLASALRMGAEQRPDVILLDLNLGDEDGLMLFDRLEESPGLKDVPIIVFSVHDSRFDEAMEKGAVTCLRKPFKGKALVEAVGPYLARRAAAAP